ncbi:MAG: hypothetical protein ABJF11_15285 [Reichenbachiella sp.]|uniref:hypothetical protein n=1 Tax=Reichenbachiella sp. TaxID=2184521 RepID=UPI003263611C
MSIIDTFSRITSHPFPSKIVVLLSLIIGFISLLPSSMFAQSEFYHADSADVHLYPTGHLDETKCLALYDTSVIEMHTWYYYEPYCIITDSIYYIEDKSFHEQRVFKILADKKIIASLRYYEDTVYVKEYYTNHTHEYQANKLTEFQTKPYKSSDMTKFGWSTRERKDGTTLDSIYIENDQIAIYKQYYENGQLKRHEFIKSGIAKRIDYKENGKVNKSKKLKRQRHRNLIYIPDSLDVQIYTPGKGTLFDCIALFDTTHIKYHTWRYSSPYRMISDSSYFTGDDLVQVQKVYKFFPKKEIVAELIYSNDTVRVELYGTNSLIKYSATKVNFTGNNWYEVNSYNRDGWSVTTENGYISDSTFYENDNRKISKQFYANGQLKLYYNNGKTLEYKKNGKVRNKISFSLLDVFAQ